MTHFLSLPRPSVTGPPSGVVDTTTLAAHDFDVDTRTGFMPPQQPIQRLPIQWHLWESTLDEAINRNLQLGDKLGLLHKHIIDSESWRDKVRQVCLSFSTLYSPSLTHTDLAPNSFNH